MKNNRQSMILDIIAKEHIETQEQLLEQLRQRGVASTQATISRDIKQIKSSTSFLVTLPFSRAY